MKKEMPTIERKELKEFRVTRKAMVEFEFVVYAEDSSEAENIVDDSVHIEEYDDMFGISYNDSYYDNGGEICKIDRAYASGGSWDCSSYAYYTEEGGEKKEIFKFEEDDWDDDYNVYADEQLLIDEWKEQNGDVEDSDEDEDE
jgi:hypothetical protein